MQIIGKIIISKEAKYTDQNSCRNMCLTNLILLFASEFISVRVMKLDIRIDKNIRMIISTTGKFVCCDSFVRSEIPRVGLVPPKFDGVYVL